MASAQQVQSPAPVSPRERCNKLIDGWAQEAARDRFKYLVLEVLLLILSAAVAVAGAYWHDNAVPAAVLGGLVALLTGLRHLFRWQTDFTRLTSSRQILIEECRDYDNGAPPYEDEKTRDMRLTTVLNSVEAKTAAALDRPRR